jgi:hypothetical protein
MRILKKRRSSWTISYAYFEGKESYLDILLCVFLRNGELLGHSPIRILNVQVTPFLQNTHRRMTK